MPHCEIQIQFVLWLDDEAHASTKILLIVNVFIITPFIAEISSINITEQMAAEGKALVDAMVVGKI